MDNFDPATALKAYFPSEIAVLNLEARQKFIDAIEALQKENENLEAENKALKKRAAIF